MHRIAYVKIDVVMMKIANIWNIIKVIIIASSYISSTVENVCEDLFEGFSVSCQKIGIFENNNIE